MNILEMNEEEARREMRDEWRREKKGHAGNDKKKER